MSDVTLIAYGDELHAYDAGDESADIVYTVAIGANLDAMRQTVTAEKFERIAATLSGVMITVTDHRLKTVVDPDEYQPGDICQTCDMPVSKCGHRRVETRDLSE